MLKGKKTQPLSGVFETSVYVNLSLLIFLIGLSLVLKISLFSLLSQIKESYLFFFIKSAEVGEINGVSFHYHVYIFIILSSLLALSMRFLFCRRQKKPFSFKDHCQLIPQITCIVLVWLISIQTINRTQIFKSEIELFQGRSTEAKISFMHKSYALAKYFKNLLPGRHRCQFITDLDPAVDETYMFFHWQLSYFLFPTIDIRDIYLDEPVDCVIISTKEAAKNIPEGFEMKGRYNPYNVLAVKRTRSPQ